MNTLRNLANTLSYLLESIYRIFVFLSVSNVFIIYVNSVLEVKCNVDTLMVLAFLCYWYSMELGRK